MVRSRARSPCAPRPFFSLSPAARTVGAVARQRALLLGGRGGGERAAQHGGERGERENQGGGACFFGGDWELVAQRRLAAASNANPSRPFASVPRSASSSSRPALSHRASASSCPRANERLQERKGGGSGERWQTARSVLANNFAIHESESESVWLFIWIWTMMSIGTMRLVWSLPGDAPSAAAAPVN